MAHKKHLKLTPARVAILNVLGQCGEGAAYAVYEELKRHKKDVTPASVLRMMQLMARDGLLKRNDRVWPHVYALAPETEDAPARSLRNAVREWFGGRESKALLTLLPEFPLPPEDIEEAERLLAKMKQNQARRGVSR